MTLLREELIRKEVHREAMHDEECRVVVYRSCCDERCCGSNFGTGKLTGLARMVRGAELCYLTSCSRRST